MHCNVYDWAFIFAYKKGLFFHVAAYVSVVMLTLDIFV